MWDVLGVLAVAIFGGTVLTILGVLLGKPEPEPAAGQEKDGGHGKDASDDPAVCECRRKVRRDGDEPFFFGASRPEAD